MATGVCDDRNATTAQISTLSNQSKKNIISKYTFYGTFTQAGYTNIRQHGILSKQEEQESEASMPTGSPKFYISDQICLI